MGSCYMGRRKMSFVPLFPGFADIQALLLIILLGTLHAAFMVVGPILPTSWYLSLQGVKGAHPKAAFLWQILCTGFKWMPLCVAALRFGAFLCDCILQHLSVIATRESLAWLPEMFVRLSVSSFDCSYWLVLNHNSWWESIWISWHHIRHQSIHGGENLCKCSN